MTIRNYQPEDISQIDRLDSFLALQIHTHSGILKENIFTAEENGEFAGIGFLILHQTLQADQLKITFSLYLNDSYLEDAECENLLIDRLLCRFCEIQREKPDIDIYLSACCEADEISYMQFLLEKGFLVHAAVPVLCYNLKQEITHYPLPAGITIQRLELNEKSMAAFLHADFLAGSEPNAEADVWFLSGDSSFTCFAAMDRNIIAGAVSVWNLSIEHGATENIFVIPSHRRKKIAHELIATALEELKQRGLKLASLSLSGSNLAAMRLYLSTGYRLSHQMIELRYQP